MNQPGRPDDDTALLAAVHDLWAQVDPVPGQVLDAARGAFAWRDVDAELVELILDSRLEVSAVRSADGPRLLTFATAGLTIEVEVAPAPTGRNLVGQLVPPGPATITVRCPGPDRVVEADELGRFSVAGVPPGPVSLLCLRRPDQGPPLATSWVHI